MKKEGTRLAPLFFLLFVLILVKNSLRLSSEELVDKVSFFLYFLDRHNKLNKAIQGLLCFEIGRYQFKARLGLMCNVVMSICLNETDKLLYEPKIQFE